MKKEEIKGQFNSKTYWITDHGIVEFLAEKIAIYNDKYIKKGIYPSSGVLNSAIFRTSFYKIFWTTLFA